MKVLHLISGGDTGGAKTHVFSLLDKLKEKADVKIVCFMKGVFWEELQNIDVESELLEQKSRFDMSVLDRLCEIVNDGIEVVHCHGARANFIASFLKKRVNVPMITTIHSDYLLDFDGFYRKLVYTGLNVLALRKFKYYIAVSSNFKDMLIQRKFRPNSVFTVYNGMDYSKEMKHVSKEEFATRVGIEYNEKYTYVGIIGRHDYVKGHDVFIKAIKNVVKECLNTRFIIAGDGENRQNLVNLAKSEGIEDKLIFAGFVKDIYSFINFIDINVLSSRCESFPYVLLEGARMAKPTVSSAVGGIPDLIHDGKTGLLFDSENDSMLSEKLIYFIQNKEVAKKCGEELYKLATTNFSSEALAQKHMEIYNAVKRDSTEKKKYDAVLSGYYGFNNSGDDALLFAIVKSLKEKMPDIRICVLSAKAEKTQSHYKIDCVPRFNPFKLRKALKDSKMLISGGGSLVQDATSSKSLIYYLYVMNTAKKFGAKLYVYANGIGPLKEKNLKRAKKVLEKADMITLRESASLEELKRMNLENKNVLVTADPALFTEGADIIRVEEIFKKESIPEKSRFFGISVRNWQENEVLFKEKIAEVLDYANEKYGLIPLFIPMRFPHDVKISTEIAEMTKAKSYIIKNMYSVEDTIGIVSVCEMVFGMRLHTLIYAASSKVPVVGLIYDKKVSGFLEHISQNRSIDVRGIDVKKAKGYIDEIMENKVEISKILADKKEELYTLANKNAMLAMQLLGYDK